MLHGTTLLNRNFQRQFMGNRSYENLPINSVSWTDSYKGNTKRRIIYSEVVLTKKTLMLTYSFAFGLEPSEDEVIRSKKRVCLCKTKEKPQMPVSYDFYCRWKKDWNFSLILHSNLFLAICGSSQPFFHSIDWSRFIKLTVWLANEYCCLYHDSAMFWAQKIFISPFPLDFRRTQSNP